MKLATIVLAAATAFVAACPGQDRALEDLNIKLSARQSGPNDSDEMIGDLATTGATTTVGKAVKGILEGSQPPMSDDSMGLVSSVLCLLPGADPCCIWYVITAYYISRLSRLPVLQWFDDILINPLQESDLGRHGKQIPRLCWPL